MPNGARDTCSLIFFKIQKQQIVVSKYSKNILDIVNDVFYQYAKSQNT
jgi:hypothetical protein